MTRGVQEHPYVRLWRVRGLLRRARAHERLPLRGHSPQSRGASSSAESPHGLARQGAHSRATSGRPGKRLRRLVQWLLLEDHPWRPPTRATPNATSPANVTSPACITSPAKVLMPRCAGLTVQMPRSAGTVGGPTSLDGSSSCTASALAHSSNPATSMPCGRASA
jgi:hypothetical protein